MSGFWRKCRTAFRWCRFCLWSVILLALLALAWVNVIGLPDFLKDRITQTLRDRGVQLEFTRMRLRLIHGLVVDNVRVGDISEPSRPLLTAGEVQLRLDYPALLHGRFLLDGAVLRNGKFTLPVSPTNSLVVLKIQAEVRFLPEQTWSLDDLQADFADARLRLSGQLTHAPEIASWKIFTGRIPAERGALSEPLKEFSDQLAQIHFTGQPQLGATLNGDARDIHSFILRVNARVPDVSSPWCSASGLQFAARLSAPADARTNFDAALDFWTNALPFRLAWIARATKLHTDQIDATEVKCHGLWSAPELSVQQVSAQLGGGTIEFAAALNVATRNLTFTNSSDLDPHVFGPLLSEDVRRQLSEILWTQPPFWHADGNLKLPPWAKGPPRSFDELLPALRFNGDLTFSNAVLYGAIFELVRTHFTFSDSIFSLPDLDLAQNRSVLNLKGQYSTVTENFRLALRGTLDDASVRPLLENTAAAPGLEIVQFTEPLVLNLNAAGNLATPDLTTATGHLSLTNFAVRGQTLQSLDTDLVCSNRVLSFLHPQAFRSLGTQTVTADSITLDFNAWMIYFTNGYSTFDEMVIPRAIGPKTAYVVEPYQYLSPPTARVHGQFPLRNIDTGRDLAGTDMTFEVDRGAPFCWSRLLATNLTGTLHWLGQSLVLTNLAAKCYGGNAMGGAYFDFRPVGYGCDFNFNVQATNLDVHAMAVGLSGSKTNQVEGRLTAQVTITKANSDTWSSWYGYGSAKLYNGVLWNIPLFGFLTPMLNSVAPGLGNSRATEASLDFFMTNGVANTRSLLISTPTMRLQYVGTVDLEQHVNAYVTAQLMRNTWGIGPVVSAVLWPVSKIFECRVTGLVSEPKVTPILFPFSKYLFSPVRSMQDLFVPPDLPAAAGQK